MESEIYRYLLLRLFVQIDQPQQLLAKIEDMRGNTQDVIERCREALRIDLTDQNAFFRLTRAVGKSDRLATGHIWS